MSQATGCKGFWQEKYRHLQGLSCIVPCTPVQLFAVYKTEILRGCDHGHQCNDFPTMKRNHADVWERILKTKHYLDRVKIKPAVHVDVGGEHLVGTIVSAIPPCEPDSPAVGLDVCTHCASQRKGLETALARTLSNTQLPARLRNPQAMQTEIRALKNDLQRSHRTRIARKEQAVRLAKLFNHKSPQKFFDSMVTLFTSETMEVQGDIILNMINRITAKKTAEFSSAVLDAALITSVKMGRRNYEFIRTLLNWPSITCIKAHNPTSNIEQEGITEAAFLSAKVRYGELPCFASFDGTRILRILEVVALAGFAEALPANKRRFLAIVGLGWWGNARHWPFHLTVQDVLDRYNEDGDTCEMDALRRFIDEVRATPTLLAREVRVHMLACIDSGRKSMPTGVHPRLPLPGGLRHTAIISTIMLERRLAFLDSATQLLASAADWLMLIGSAFDPEPSHMKAAKLLATIRANFTKYVSLGCSWEMYAMPILGPLPCIFLMDWEHILRLFYKRVVQRNYATGGEKVAYATKYIYKSATGNRIITISTACLEALFEEAQKKGISCGFTLDDLDIALYFDSKTDAALRVFTRRNIELLKTHNIPDAEGFILYAGAVLDIMEPITVTTNKDPYDRLKQMATGVSFFRHLFVYTKLNKGLEQKNNCIHQELMTCVEMLFAARIALTLTMFHWFFDTEFLENLNTLGTGGLECFISFIQNKTNQNARPGTVPPSMADVLQQLKSAQFVEDALRRLSRKDPRLSATENKKRKKVAQMLLKVGTKNSQTRAGHGIPKGDYKGFVQYLTAACEDGFREDEKRWANISDGIVKDHMVELGMFGMAALTSKLPCIGDPTNLPEGAIFDGSDEHQQEVMENAVQTLSWVELDNRAGAMKNAGLFAGFTTKYDRLFEWQERATNTWTVPARPIKIKVDPADEGAGDSDGEESMDRTMNFQKSAGQTSPAGPIQSNVDADDSGDNADDTVVPDTVGHMMTAANRLTVTDNPGEPHCAEPVSATPTDTTEQKHTKQVLVNMLLSDILNCNDLEKLNTNNLDLTAMGDTMNNLPRQLHQLEITTTDGGKQPSIRVREVKKGGSTTNPMWVTNTHTTKQGVKVIYDIHIQSAFRVCQLGNHEWISRERFKKFLHALHLRGCSSRDDGIDLWTGSIIIYSTQPGAFVVGRVIELCGHRRVRNSTTTPTGMEDSTKTPTGMEEPSTDDDQDSCQRVPYAEPDLPQQPRAGNKRKLPGTKTPKSNPIKQFKECKSSQPGLTITCRIYNRRVGTDHDYELDPLTCEAGVTPGAVWAFSNHESLRIIPSYKECIRLDSPALATLINANMQTSCDANADTQASGAEMTNIQQTRSASVDSNNLSGLQSATANAIQQAIMAMTDTTNMPESVAGNANTQASDAGMTDIQPAAPASVNATVPPTRATPDTQTRGTAGTNIPTRASATGTVVLDYIATEQSDTVNQVYLPYSS
jgi:hypothetical protein